MFSAGHGDTRIQLGVQATFKFPDTNETRTVTVYEGSGYYYPDPLVAKVELEGFFPGGEITAIQIVQERVDN